jgi:hypothetical protein
MTVEVMPSEKLPVDTRRSKLVHEKWLPMPMNGTMYVMGSPGAGKSSFIWSFLNNWTKNYFDELVIFCLTKDSWATWEKVKQKNVWVGLYDEKKLKEYLDDLETEQVQRIEEGKYPRRVCIMLDDCAGGNVSRVGKTTILDQLSLNLRHLNILLIVASQRFRLFSPTFRNAIHYMVVYRLPKNDFDKLADEYSDPLTPDVFESLFFNHIQQNHQYFMIDMRAPLNQRFRLSIDKPITISIESPGEDKKI